MKLVIKDLMNLMIMTDEIKDCPDRCNGTLDPLCLYWKNHVYGVPCMSTVKKDLCPRGYHVAVY